MNQPGDKLYMARGNLLWLAPLAFVSPNGLKVEEVDLVEFGR
jgi:hypothetical protein